jgi:putative nucleotidyltransferase with HDIG domain
MNSRILIVDDEAPIRALLGEHLRQEGFEVTLAHNGAAGLEALTKADFELVLTDVRMPGMSGLELLAEIVRKHPGVGVLMLTACEDLTLAVNAMRIGALDYVLKPFRLAELTLSVQGALQRRKNLVEQTQRMRLLEETVNERTAELRRLLDSLHDASEITLEALVAALDAREHETQAHSKRVSEYTLYLAREMSVDALDLDVIRRGAMLHDIGKIGIPDSILLKPGKLTDEEFDVIRTHTTIGAQLLSGSQAPLLQLAEEIALTHHERWDGSGYPAGLAGDRIPIAGRIVSVVDVFDALTHDRPYKDAWPIGAAVEEILRQAGRQFDPAVVEAFQRLDHAALLEAIPAGSDDGDIAPRAARDLRVA